MAGKTPYPLPAHCCPIIALSFLRKFIFKTNGVLGEYPRAEMISKLEAEVNKWQRQSLKRFLLHYIAVTAVLEDYAPHARCLLNKLTLF
jgi:hypothetical protein